MPIDQREAELIQYVERLHREGSRVREGTDLDHVELHQKWVRGAQWPSNTPRADPQFVLNLLNDHVQRKAGLLTDARPILDVVAKKAALRTNADILKSCLQSVWDETSWTERLTKGLGFAMIAGSNVGMMQWDPLADHGLGDLRPTFFDPRSVVVDPGVMSAVDVDNGEFVVTEEVRSIYGLIEQFGEVAEYVRPDAGTASYPEPTAGRRGLLSAAAGVMGRRRRRTQVEPSAIQKAFCRHYWFKDWDRYSDGSEKRYRRIAYTNGTYKLIPVPRIIRHIVIAGGKVLADEPNPYWHKKYPIEILDWGMETDHPWGQSEVRMLRSPQETLNRLASQMLKNATLMNNFRIQGDINALDPDQWDSLSNRPAITVKQRPNTRLAFESPPSLPPYLFTLVEFLVRSVEMIGGLNEAAKGSGSAGQSGITVEALQLAAQTVIRLQARRIESFLTRLFSKAIPMIFQYYTRNRIRTLYTEEGALQSFDFQRAALVLGIGEADVKTAFRDFVFSVRPESSLNASRVQKAVLASNLYNMGLIPAVDVLRVLEWKDPEDTYERAQEERKQAAIASALAKASMGGGGQQPVRGQAPRPSSGRGIQSAAAGGRSVQSFPASGGGTMGG